MSKLSTKLIQANMWLNTFFYWLGGIVFGFTAVFGPFTAQMFSRLDGGDGMSVAETIGMVLLYMVLSAVFFFAAYGRFVALVLSNVCITAYLLIFGAAWYSYFLPILLWTPVVIFAFRKPSN